MLHAIKARTVLFQRAPFVTTKRLLRRPFETEDGGGYNLKLQTRIPWEENQCGRNYDHIIVAIYDTV